MVSARLGVVLSKEGGIIKKLAPLFALGGGGIIGDGQQVLSWVALDDAARVRTQCTQPQQRHKYR